jgi:hypothetical protein
LDISGSIEQESLDKWASEFREMVANTVIGMLNTAEQQVSQTLEGHRHEDWETWFIHGGNITTFYLGSILVYIKALRIAVQAAHQVTGGLADVIAEVTKRLGPFGGAIPMLLGGTVSLKSASFQTSLQGLEGGQVTLTESETSR